MLKIISILGLFVMVGALIGLYKIGVLFTAQPIAIALQLIAVYTAACLFGWGPIVVHWSLVSFGLGILLLLGALMRMMCEERLVTQKYPEYVEYAKVTKRMVPYLF